MKRFPLILIEDAEISELKKNKHIVFGDHRSIIERGNKYKKEALEL